MILKIQLVEYKANYSHPINASTNLSQGDFTLLQLHVIFTVFSDIVWMTKEGKAD